MTSIARQNYHLECEAAINKQINLELYASYVYMSMAYYCDRDDIAMKGFHLFFKKASDEERDHAEKVGTHGILCVSVLIIVCPGCHIEVWSG